METHAWADGRTVSFYLRVPYEGRRYRITLGTNHEGWSTPRAEVELEKVMGQIARGTWAPPTETADRSDGPDPDEIVQTTLSRWWARKQRDIGDGTLTDYEARIGHLILYKPRTRTAAINAHWVDGLRDHLAGKGLGPRRVNMVLGLLASALDDAVDYGLLDANPARGPRRRLKEPPKVRGYLEPDMVVDLLDAAGEWEQTLQPAQRYGRRALLAMLVLTGPRIAELLEATRGGLDIHAGILRLGKKTEAGMNRTLELPVAAVDELRPHLAAVPARVGGPHRPGMPLFPSRTGGRLGASNVRNRLLRGAASHRDGNPTKSAVERANEKRAAEGRMLIPHVTPHTLRRTFATFAVWAGRDLRWIMGQLGHADPDTTLKIYAQAMKRRQVDEQLVWRLMRFADEPETPSNRPTNRPTGEIDQSDRTGTVR